MAANDGHSVNKKTTGFVATGKNFSLGNVTAKRDFLLLLRINLANMEQTIFNIKNKIEAEGSIRVTEF